MTGTDSAINLNDLLGRVGAILKSRAISHEPMPVGFGLMGLHVRLADGREVAVKAGKPRKAGHLLLEASMLNDLARLTELPVPEVLHAEDDLLLMSWIDGGTGSLTDKAQSHAAELLAELHALRFDSFGYEHDTAIGPLTQPNPSSSSWISFFRDHRLLHMSGKAADSGALPAPLHMRLQEFAGHLGDYLTEPSHPSLIHGDVWSGNVLSRDGRITGLVDPALSWSHPEIELAFTTLFGTFTRPFFDAYDALVGIDRGFHEVRKDIYNLYPLLVHVRLFGGSYLAPIDATLRRLGF
ncbi:MAG: fructosamine kinase family protein [Pseudomonadota bacterium]|nr:fructosamine kinase family protein [Pseudomonadota bacterium]